MVKNVVDGVWHYLSQKPDLIALLGADPIDGTPYLFQDDLIMGHEYLENSQKAAVVIAYQGEWSAPNNFNTAQFPRLIVDVWGDPDRHDDGSPVSTFSARDKVDAVTESVMKHLHRIGNFDERWGENRVFASTRLMMYRNRGRGQEFQGQPDGNGLTMSTLYFGLTTA